MPIADAAAARLAHVARHTGLTVAEDAQRVESWSNDVWRCGEVIVRICHLGDVDRLMREARIGAALPNEARYPRVLDSGRDEAMAWMLVERLDGESINHTWHAMPGRELRPIIEQLVDALRALHTWHPPADVLAMLQAHAADEPEPTADAAIGHDILPLPSPRWHALADAARTLPFVDPGMVRAVVDRLDALASHDPFADPGEHVAHGDVNYSNLLVHEGRLVALLDYEWARLGPPEAELTQLLRSSRQWHADDPVPPPVVAWIQELYPEMFAAPDVRERAWIAELAYNLRQLVLWPPREHEPDWHPVNVLPRLVDAPWQY